MKSDFQKPVRDGDSDAQAAVWVMRRDRGLSPAEQDDYLRWMGADPGHRESMARQEQAWSRLDKLAWGLPEGGPPVDPDLLVRPRKGRKYAVILPLALAAAAMVAWVLVVNRARIAPATAAPVPAAVLAPAPEAPAVARDYEAMNLPDGSLIELNRGAAVDVRFTAGERDVRLLCGEAQFTVAKNPRRPFVVTAGGVGVRAVGTAFDVTFAGPEVEVLVTEGRVQVVSGPGNRTAVAAGHVAVFSLASAAPPPRVAAVSLAQVDARLAWRPEMISCADTPLSKIAAQFNRHNREKLVVADPGTGSIKLNLLSFRSNNVDGFVRLLEASYGVRAVPDGDTVTLRRAP